MRQRCILEVFEKINGVDFVTLMKKILLCNVHIQIYIYTHNKHGVSVCPAVWLKML